MPRIDAWDVHRPNRTSPDLGFRRGLEDVYEWGPELGRGGFGTVRVVKRRSDGREFACKSLAKVLPNASPPECARHVEMIGREAAVLGKLHWSLSVVGLEGVYEDRRSVHIVMECCRGGELLRRAGDDAFSEEAVARIMRAVLRTLAQCHANHVLHRDIKPGNFMFLTNDQNSPIKAVDFGMAVFYDPKELPRRDLGFDGTPWFMAPEVLSSQVGPESDVWSAGVMAYQLLTGYLPFDDRKHKRAPMLSVIWKAILTEEPSFERKYWGGISNEAVDLVRSLLQKDPAKRPTAKQALKHPWLRHGGAKPTQLTQTVVQRIQRYGRSSIFKRTVLDMIADELLQKKTCFGHRDTTRLPSAGSAEWRAQRIIAREALDASVGAGGRSYLDPIDIGPRDHRLLAEDDPPWSEGSLTPSPPGWPDAEVRGECGFVEEMEEGEGSEAEEAEGGSFAWFDIPSAGGGATLSENKAALQEARPQITSGEMQLWQQRQQNYQRFVQPPFGLWQSAPHGTAAFAQACIGCAAGDLAMAAKEFRGREVYWGSSGWPGALGSCCSKSILSDSLDKEDVGYVLRCLQLSSHGAASADDVTQGLRELGYALEPGEVSSLMKSMAPGNNGTVNLSQFLASQVDWQDVQRNSWEEWLDGVKQAFDDLDKDADGRIKFQDILAALEHKFPSTEVEAALEQGAVEMCPDDMEMDFEGLVSMLRVDSSDSLASLDDFDARLVSHHGPSSLYASTLATVPEY